MLSVIVEVVTPVKTGVQKTQFRSKDWIPAFAGMTEMAAFKETFFEQLKRRKSFENIDTEFYRTS